MKLSKANKEIKPIKKLIKKLSEAEKIINSNIDVADNIDLVDMGDILQKYIVELKTIKDFEKYPEEAE